MTNLEKDIQESDFHIDDIIETPTFYDLVHGKVSWKDYLNGLPIKFGEYVHNILQH